METLKVFIIQPDIIKNNPEENKIKYENIIKTLKKPNLVVLPEMFLTGFDADQPASPERMDGLSVQWFKDTSKNHNIALIGSMAIEENGRLFNRMLFSDSGSDVVYYDKRYLFPLSNESKDFSRGHRRVLFETGGWKLFPQICYDLRFPEFSRNNLNYDVLVYVANWPAARSEHWEIMLRSRAVENQSYALGCNRVGTDQNNVVYSGDSLIVGPMGRVLGRGPKKEFVLEYTLTKKLLSDTRSNLPFLNDIGSFSLNDINLAD